MAGDSLSDNPKSVFTERPVHWKRPMSLDTSENRDITTNDQPDRKNVSSVFSTFDALLDATKSDTLYDHTSHIAGQSSDGDDITTGFAFVTSSFSYRLTCPPVPPPSGSALKTSEKHINELWSFDTGATHHITADISHLINPKPTRVEIEVGGGNVLYSTMSGTVRFKVEYEGRVIGFSLSNVLYIPKWNSDPLISWNVISSKCVLTAENDWILITNKPNKAPIFKARRIQGLFRVSALIERGIAYMSSAQFWHECLGHSSVQSWNDASSRYSDGHLLPSRPSKFFCESCAKANSRNIPPPGITDKRSDKPYELVHTDLAGPFSVQSLGGKSYYMTFIDDYSRFAEIRFLSKKSEAVQALKDFCEKVHTTTKQYPRNFRSDRGGEYINKVWSDYCNDKGITHQPTPAYSPQSNGVAERFNLTIANMSRIALLHAPRYLWGEALNSAVYLRNRLPHTVLQGKSLYEVL